nr:MAG TPA: ribosomal RNA-processing protein 7 [Caudoviricetes sp.]
MTGLSRSSIKAIFALEMRLIQNDNMNKVVISPDNDGFVTLQH